MADEGLHEIQLNGKQLVFLFMASTVVAVVIFLCGVMVGRGVRAQRASEATEASTEASTDPTVIAQTAQTSSLGGPAVSSAPSSGSSVPSQETLTYPNRLEGAEPAEETLTNPAATTLAAPAASSARSTVIVPPAPKSAVAKSAKTATESSTPAAAASAKVAAANAAPANAAPANAVSANSASANSVSASSESSGVGSEPAGNGFVVQVAAVNNRKEAETIAKRLAGKGYPSFVTTPGTGAPRMFRVRIGKYKDRREAETIATKLEKEEQFKPWITR
jgi:cell division septation protein DedD